MFFIICLEWNGIYGYILNEMEFWKQVSCGSDDLVWLAPFIAREKSRIGKLWVEASGDVTIVGEVIELNDRSGRSDESQNHSWLFRDFSQYDFKFSHLWGLLPLCLVSGFWVVKNMWVSVFLLFLFQRFQLLKLRFQGFPSIHCSCSGLPYSIHGSKCWTLDTWRNISAAVTVWGFCAYFVHHPDGSKIHQNRVVVASIPKIHQNTGTCSNCEVALDSLDSLDMFDFTLSSCR